MTESATTASLCHNCKSPLNAGAVYCLHCESYQNWRRHLSLSSSVLALLVALVTVTSASAPTVVGALRRQYSQVELSLLDYDRPSFTILAVNQGNRRAVLAAVRLRVGRLGDHPFTIPAGQRVIAGDEVRELQFQVARSDDLKYLLSHMFWDGVQEQRVDRADVGANVFEAEVVDFDGRKTVREIPIPRAAFERLLQDVFPDRALPGPPPEYSPY